MKPASYGNYVVTIKDLPSIGMEVFRADSSNYDAKVRELRARKNGDPVQLQELSVLIRGMFAAKVVETCAVSFGTKLTFKLAEQDEHGRELLLDPALQRFRTAFAAITQKEIEVVWEDTGQKASKSSGGRDFTGVWEALIRGLDEAMNVVTTVLLFEWLDD